MNSPMLTICVSKTEPALLVRRQKVNLIEEEQADATPDRHECGYEQMDFAT